MTAYELVKNSGEILGSVPSHWCVQALHLKSAAASINHPL